MRNTANIFSTKIYCLLSLRVRKDPERLVFQEMTKHTWGHLTGNQTAVWVYEMDPGGLVLMSDQEPEIPQQQLKPCLNKIWCYITRQIHITAVCLILFTLSGFYVELKDNLALIFVVSVLDPPSSHWTHYISEALASGNCVNPRQLVQSTWFDPVSPESVNKVLVQ